MDNFWKELAAEEAQAIEEYVKAIGELNQKFLRVLPFFRAADHPELQLLAYKHIEYMMVADGVLKVAVVRK